ncbi:unnamed protein product, partial [Staurois parvus]
MGPPGNRGSWGPCVLAQTQKSLHNNEIKIMFFSKEHTFRINNYGTKINMCRKIASSIGLVQGRTDNSWGPQAIGDHGAPVSLPKLKKAYVKGTRGISWVPPTDPGPSGSARVSKWSVCP